MNSNLSSLCSFIYLDDYAICHITKMTWVWRALVDLSKSFVCICSLQISGFAGFTALHLSNPAICICRQVISIFSFGAALDFSQKKFCIFQVQSSAFSFRWYPHLSEPVVFFTAHQSDFTRPNHFHSTLPAEWLMGVVFLSLTNNLQLSKNNSLRLEINVQKALPENSRIIWENIWSGRPCPGRASLTLIHIIHQSPPSPRKM